MSVSRDRRRKVRRKVYRPHNPRWFNHLLRLTYGTYIKYCLHTKARGMELFADLKPPYAVLPTHTAMLDPFMVGIFIPEPVYWIASDSNLRSGLLRTLLGLVGTIPKSKFIPDIDTIHAIVHVVRKQHGIIGIFPEGTASLDGTSLPLVPATGKLLKLLKIPVVTATIHGGYCSMPRWARKRRRGPIEIEFKLLMSAHEIIQTSSEQVLQRLVEALQYDDTAWAQHSGRRYHTTARAEHLETILFVCPACRAAGSLRSHGHRISCMNCGVAATVSSSYRLKSDQAAPTLPDNIPHWNQLQQQHFTQWLEDHNTAPHDQTLFCHRVRRLKTGEKLAPLNHRHCDSISCTFEHVMLASSKHSGRPTVLPIAEIEGEGIFKNNMLEFYHHKRLYQIRFTAPHASALQWVLAIRQLRERLQRHATTPSAL